MALRPFWSRKFARQEGEYETERTATDSKIDSHSHSASKYIQIMGESLRFKEKL